MRTLADQNHTRAVTFIAAGLVALLVSPASSPCRGGPVIKDSHG
jgi:hypothetical protein